MPPRGAAVGSQHDVGIECGVERVEVTTARRGEEGVDHLPLAGEIGVGHRGCSLHPATGSARPVLATQIGSGTCTPSDSSRRVLQDRSMLRQTRAVTVVSRPPSAHVLDVVSVGDAQPQPGLLQGIVGFGHRTKRPGLRRVVSEQ